MPFHKNKNGIIYNVCHNSWNAFYSVFMLLVILFGLLLYAKFINLVEYFRNCGWDCKNKICKQIKNQTPTAVFDHWNKLKSFHLQTKCDIVLWFFGNFEKYEDQVKCMFKIVSLKNNYSWGLSSFPWCAVLLLLINDPLS